jgi:hypothetical protein
VYEGASDNISKLIKKVQQEKEAAQQQQQARPAAVEDDIDGAPIEDIDGVTLPP